MSPENSGLGKTSGFVGVGKNGKLAAKPPGSHCKTGIVAVLLKNQMKTVRMADPEGSFLLGQLFFFQNHSGQLNVFFQLL